MKTPEFVTFVIGAVVWMIIASLVQKYVSTDWWFFWGAITGSLCYKIWKFGEVLGKELRNDI